MKQIIKELKDIEYVLRNIHDNEIRANQLNNVIKKLERK